MSEKKDKEEDDPTKTATLETQTGILSEEGIKKKKKPEICRDLNKESTTESDSFFQLSQAMFVPESLEDDGSLIIPPTPEEGDSVLLIIPSTPTEQQGTGIDGVSDLKNKGEEKQRLTEKCEKEEEKVVCFISSMASSANDKTEIPESQEGCRHPLESSDMKMSLAVSDSGDTTVMKASWDDSEMPSKFENFEGSDVDDWCLHLSASETTESMQLTFDEVGDKKDRNRKDLPHEECSNVVVEKDSDKIFNRPTFCLESQCRNSLAAVTESQPKLSQEILSSTTRDMSEKNSAFSDNTKSMLMKKVTIHSEAEHVGEDVSSSRHGSADFTKKKSQVRDSIFLASSQSDVEMVSDFKQNSAFNKKENFSDAVEDDDTPDVVALKRKISDDELQFENTPSENPLINSDVQEISCCTPFKKQKTKELIDVNDAMVMTESPSLDIHNNDRSEKGIQTSIEEMSTTSKFRTYLGSYSDSASLSNLMCAAGGEYSSKDVDSILNLQTVSDEREFVYSRSTIIKKFILKDNRIYQSVEVHEHHLGLQDAPDVGVSPETSTSTASKKTSHRSSVTSGELADISSSISSSGFHHDSIPLSSQTLSSLDGSSEASILSGKGIGSCRPILSNIPSLKLSVSSAHTDVQGSENNKVGEHQLDKGATKLSNLEEMTKPARLEAEIFNKLPKCVPGRKKNANQSILPHGRCLPRKVSANDIAKPTEEVKTNLVLSNECNFDFSVNTKGRKKRLSRNGKRSSKKKRKKNVVYNEELRCDGIPDIKFLPKSPAVVSQNVDSPTPGHTILPGVRVMARWRDGFYYPGVVISQEVEGRWVTKFDDGANRIVPEENLFKITSLQVGTSVLVRSSDDYYDPGIISGHYREADEIGYIVELDSGPSKRFPRACVILSTDQANILLGYKLSIVSPSSAVSLDNIVNGKRRRTPVICPTTSPLRMSLKRRVKNPDSNLDNTESSANEAVSAAKVLYTEMGDEAKLQDELLLPCEYQSPLVSNQNKKIARRSLPLRKVGRQVLHAQFQSSTSSDGTSDNLEITRPIAKSSVPELVTTGRNIFQGYAFLLSQSDKKLDAKGKMPDFEREWDFEDIIMHTKVHDVQFDKEYLCNQIKLEGGIVFDSFEESQKSVKTKKVFLIASSYLRTIKYIQCLASNTFCVEHKWIIDCCHSKEVLDYRGYLLPAGFGLIEGREIEWHGKRDALKGLKIVLLCPKKPSFVEAWTPVLLAAKADLVQKWNLPTFTSHGSTFIVDFIVTDSSCPNKVVAAARRRHIPVVSTEWVIQCLITGVRLPHDSHPKFQYNFIE